MGTQMSIKKLEASLHIAHKLEQVIKDGEEVPQGLPSGLAVEAYAVDEYPGCPTNWMNGSHIASSYFFGVEKEKGMWINFNNCFAHEHDVAIVVSVQGINPITGQKMVGDNPLRLEKYVEKCPIHDIDFKQDRFCHKCGYKWPGQNYISTTNTPYGYLWIDGFRNADGSVRQYIFTEEELKGVASQIIGDDRVFAIGVAFYLSKKKKTIKPICDNNYLNGCITHIYDNSLPLGYDDTSLDLDYCDNIGTSFRYFSDHFPKVTCSSINMGAEDEICAKLSYKGICETQDITENVGDENLILPATQIKKMEVGAGALIQQTIHTDEKGLEYWQEDPFGMIYMNYCDIDALNQILEKGKRKENKEGFLKGLTPGL